MATYLTLLLFILIFLPIGKYIPEFSIFYIPVSGQVLVWNNATFIWQKLPIPLWWRTVLTDTGATSQQNVFTPLKTTVLLKFSINKRLYLFSIFQVICSGCSAWATNRQRSFAKNGPISKRLDVTFAMRICAIIGQQICVQAMCCCCFFVY